MADSKDKKIRKFKNKQYEDLKDDYETMRLSISHMNEVIDNALLKVENNIKEEDDSKASAKINALSALIYASLKVQEHMMELHANFDDLVESILPDDTIVVEDEEDISNQTLSKKPSNSDPLAKIKRYKAG